MFTRVFFSAQAFFFCGSPPVVFACNSRPIRPSVRPFVNAFCFFRVNECVCATNVFLREIILYVGCARVKVFVLRENRFGLLLRT